MTRFTAVLAAALLSAASIPALAETPYMTGDHQMRSSKMVGIPVFNERNEKIGQIDEVLLPSAGGEPSVILSVGAMTGGTKLVKVPLSHVQLLSGKMTMPDAGKAALTAMPYYNYGVGDG